MTRLTRSLLSAVLAATIVLGAQAVAQSDHIRQYAEQVGPPSDDSRTGNIGTPRFGGTLHVAADREHPHFDPYQSTLNHIMEVSNHVAEALFVLNANEQPVPALAESYAVSEDGTVYNIEIRQGVPFHDGTELTAADVVASLERWLAIGSYGRAEVSRNVVSVEATDTHSVRITLTQPFPFIIFQLSAPIGGAAFIYPASLLEQVGTDFIREPIGTGPYRFVEYRENQFVRLARFEEYAGRVEPPSGWAGGRVAYIDEIVVHYVPDEAVRIAGVESGEYHLAIDATADLMPLYQGRDDIRTRVSLDTWPAYNFNKQLGPMTDQRIREAFRAAIDITMVAAALGPPEFVTTDPALVFPTSAWHSLVGEEAYYAYDPERARALLAEAEYDGTPIRIMVDPSRAFLNTPTLVAQGMLEEVGFVVELVPVDSATFGAWREDPTRMDVFAAAYSPRPDPTLMVMLGSGHPGWFDTELRAELMEDIQIESDFEVRLGYWEQLQAHVYEYVPFMKIANLGTLHLESTRYSGAWFDVAQRYYPNTWLNE